LLIGKNALILLLLRDKFKLAIAELEFQYELMCANQSENCKSPATRISG
jgi:hypothetical protein